MLRKDQVKWKEEGGSLKRDLLKYYVQINVRKSKIRKFGNGDIFIRF